jgi:hypothetical protein
MRQNMRQNLEPVNRPAAPDLDRAIRDALAVYYGLRLGADVAEMACSDGFWPRPADSPEEGRLGGRSWAMGRGAAPPKFRRH